jgi:hypothetical protein
MQKNLDKLGGLRCTPALICLAWAQLGQSLQGQYQVNNIKESGT